MNFYHTNSEMSVEAFTEAMNARYEQGMQEAERPFSGWDFSYVTGSERLQSGMLPWSYGTMARRLLSQAERMLDMGTGGGEMLSRLLPLPPYTCATEGYLPNITLAEERLQPLGVKVLPVTDDSQLPFEDEEFDLILNRHESYEEQEVRRILTAGGLFLTQQVGWSDCRQINDRLGIPMPADYAGWELESAVIQLEQSGFRILEQREAAPAQRFYDIGALVYYLKTIPWQVPDFKEQLFREQLMEIHMEMEHNGFWEVQQKRFLILAVKE